MASGAAATVLAPISEDASTAHQKDMMQWLRGEDGRLIKADVDMLGDTAAVASSIGENVAITDTNLFL